MHSSTVSSLPSEQSATPLHRSAMPIHSPFPHRHANKASQPLSWPEQQKTQFFLFGSYVNIKIKINYKLIISCWTSEVTSEKKSGIIFDWIVMNQKSSRKKLQKTIQVNIINSVGISKQRKMLTKHKQYVL